MTYKENNAADCKSKDANATKNRFSGFLAHKGILFAVLSSFFFAIRASIIKSAPIERPETLLFLRFFLTS